jgi:hypothetical protein
LAGKRIDTIKKTGTHWTSHLSDIFNYVVAEQLFSDVDKFCNESQESSSSSSLDAESAEEAKWMIPCFDQIFTTHSFRQRTRTVLPNAIEGYRELRHRVDMYPICVDGWTQSQESQAYFAYMVTMEKLHNRKPFISAEGYVGLVPGHSMPGDIVCIIFGAIVPFVLRDVGKGKYQLIGEAYVFGIMDGEFVEGDPKEEMFCLC